MERQSISIQSPSIWPERSPPSVYQTIKTSRSISKKTRYSSYPVLRRYANYRLLCPRDNAGLLGVLESHCPAIWKAPLHFLHLQAQLIQDLQKHNHQYNICTQLTQASKTEFCMVVDELAAGKWQPNSGTIPRCNSIHGCTEKDWGAICNNVKTNGKWSFQESRLHINVLELKGALLAVQSLLKNHHQVTVSLNMDNSTAVSYINHAPRNSPR